MLALPAIEENVTTGAAASENSNPEPLHGLERLGDTHDWGAALLRLCELRGWTIDERPRLGGGVIVIACRDGCVIERAGATTADVAAPIFEEAMRQGLPG